MVQAQKTAFDDGSLQRAQQLANRLLAIRNAARQKGEQGSQPYEEEIKKQMLAGRVREFVQHFADLLSSGKIEAYNAMKAHAAGNSYSTFTRLEHMFNDVVKDDDTTFNYLRRFGFIKPFTAFLTAMKSVNPAAPAETLQKESADMAHIIDNLIREASKGRLAFASTDLIARLDRVASELEAKGLSDQAKELDTVSNTLEASWSNPAGGVVQPHSDIEHEMEPQDAQDTKNILHALDLEQGKETLKSFLNSPAEFLLSKLRDLPKEDPAVAAIAGKINTLRKHLGVSPEIFGWEGIRNFLKSEWPIGRMHAAFDLNTIATKILEGARKKGITPQQVLEGIKGSAGSAMIGKDVVLSAIEGGLDLGELHVLTGETLAPLVHALSSLINRGSTTQPATI